MHEPLGGGHELFPSGSLLALTIPVVDIIGLQEKQNFSTWKPNAMVDI